MKIVLIIIFILHNLFVFSQTPDSISLGIDKVLKTDKTANTNHFVTESINQINKIELINDSFDKYVKQLSAPNQKNNNFWKFLIPLLIGAFLTLMSQIIIEFCKNRKEKRRATIRLISLSTSKKYLIVQILKDLAMYKVHKQYYIGANKINKDDDSFEKHYQKGEQQRKTEIKLDENIAEYFQLVTEFFSLNDNPKLFEDDIKSIYEYQHPISKNFNDCKNDDELVTFLKLEEKRLNKEYKNLIKYFKNIEQNMIKNR